MENPYLQNSHMFKNKLTFVTNMSVCFVFGRPEQLCPLGH